MKTAKVITHELTVLSFVLHISDVILMAILRINVALRQTVSFRIFVRFYFLRNTRYVQRILTAQETSEATSATVIISIHRDRPTRRSLRVSHGKKIAHGHSKDAKLLAFMQSLQVGKLAHVIHP